MVSLFVLLLGVMILTACGNNKRNTEEIETAQGAYKGQELTEYNMYINFNKNVNSEFLEAKENYFASFADDNLQYIKPDGTKEIVISRAEKTQQSITDLNERLKSSPTLSLEKTTQELLPQVKIEMEVLNEMAAYYENKEYTKDDFAKGKQLHETLLKTTKTTNDAIARFDVELGKVGQEQTMAKMEELKNNGDMVAYVFADYIMKAEAVNLELQKQNIHAANILKLETCAFCLKYDELVNSYNELDAVTKDEIELDNSGLTEADMTTLKAKATKVKVDAESILDRVRSKEAVDSYALQNTTVLEKTIGTPEKLAKSFNELELEYANFLALK